MDLACQGLTFVPPDCASWLFWREADGPINGFEASTGLFPLLTSRELPFEEALDWLQFAYTADRAGDYGAPASTVLAHFAVAEGVNSFRRFWRTSGDSILRCTYMWWELPGRLIAGGCILEMGKD